MRNLRPRLPLYRLEKLPRFVLIRPVARDAVVDKHRLDRFRSKQVPRIPNIHPRGRPLADIDCVPGGLVPGAIGRVGTADGEEGFGHDARGHGVVGPDAAVDQAAGDVEVGGAVEDFGAEGDHAAGEAG